jgi:hypothetical protein
MLTCYYCKKCFRDLSLLFSHITVGCPKYSDVEGWGGFRCGMCSRWFSEVYTWRRHVLHHHAPASALVSPCKSIPSYESTPVKGLNLPGPSSGVMPAGNIFRTPEKMATSVFSDTSSQQVMQPSTASQNASKFLQQQLGLLISSFHTNTGLSFKTVQSFVDAFRCFNRDLVDVALELMSKELSTSTGDVVCEHVSSYIEQLRQTLNAVIEPLQSIYKREQYFTSLGSYIPPQDIFLGVRNEVVGRHLPPRSIPVVGQFIPLRRVLQRLLSIPGLMSEMDVYVQRCHKSPCIKHFTQSPVWMETESQHSLGADSKVYPYHIYFDDFETGNALGSHAGIHKLGGMYISLPSLPPRLASQLKYILLLYLFHSDDRTEFGNSIFKTVIDEINFLAEEGVHIKVEGFEGNVKFILGLIIGDNLGLHTILGFTQSFRANYSCRICKASKEVTISQCVEDPNLLRDQDTYLEDVDRDNVTETGVRERSVWLDVKYFDLFSHVAVDYMHDLLEGVCRYTMKVIIENLIEKNYLTLDYLNSRIIEFDYGPDSNNKPPTLKKISANSVQIKMSASECHRLVRYFSLMIGHLVDEVHNRRIGGHRKVLSSTNYEYYELYLLLRKIMDIILTEQVYPQLAEVLAIYIKDFNELFIKLSKSTLKPKFHHLIHYPRMMLRLGPIGHISSMRYESKHRAGKAAVNAGAGRVNVCKSAAKKLQLQLNHLLLTNLTAAVNLPGSLTTLPIEEKIAVIDVFSLPTDTSIYSTAHVTVADFNVTYHISDVLLLELLSEDMFAPLLMSVTNIYYESGVGKAYAKGQLFETLYFDCHFHAYKVIKTHEVKYIALDQLLFPFPNTLTPSLIDDAFFVTIRNAID